MNVKKQNKKHTLWAQDLAETHMILQFTGEIHSAFSLESTGDIAFPLGSSEAPVM